MKQQPLTDAEFDRLSALLERFGNQRTMNVEELDGFLAALICSPDSVLPSEYLPEIEAASSLKIPPLRSPYWKISYLCSCVIGTPSSRRCDQVTCICHCF
jgi:Uncharacterised protein family (UPF0149)